MDYPVPSPAPVQRHSLSWYSVAQFAFSLLAMVGLWSSALGLAAVSMGGLIARSDLNAALLGQTTLMAGGLLLCGFLVLPSAFFALRQLMGRPAMPSHRMRLLVPTLLVLWRPARRKNSRAN